MNTLWIVTSFDLLLTLRSSTPNFNRFWQRFTRMPSLRREALNVKTNWSHFWRARPDIPTILKQRSQDISGFPGFPGFPGSNEIRKSFVSLPSDLTMNHFDLSLGEQHFRVIDGLRVMEQWGGRKSYGWSDDVSWSMLFANVILGMFICIFLCEVLLWWCYLTCLTFFSVCLWESFRTCSEHFWVHIHFAASNIKFFTPSCTWKGVVAPASTPHPNLRSQATRSPVPEKFHFQWCFREIPVGKFSWLGRWLHIIAMMLNCSLHFSTRQPLELYYGSCFDHEKLPRWSQCLGPSLAPSHLLHLNLFLYWSYFLCISFLDDEVISMAPVLNSWNRSSLLRALYVSWIVLNA